MSYKKGEEAGLLKQEILILGSEEPRLIINLTENLLMNIFILRKRFHPSGSFKILKAAHK